MDDLVRADAFLNGPRVADAETTTEDDNDDNDMDGLVDRSSLIIERARGNRWCDV